MAIRLSPRFVFNAAVTLLLLIWLFVWSLGCATIPVTGVEFERKTTSTATTPVAVGDVHGPLTAITIAGATPWTLAAVLGLLGLFQTRRHGTAMGGLDRVIREIQDHEDSARDGKRNIEYETIRALQGSIERAAGRIVTCPDRHELCIRKRLKKLKK